MFCLYHFSVKCIIKTNYLPPYSPLNRQFLTLSGHYSEQFGPWLLIGYSQVAYAHLYIYAHTNIYIHIHSKAALLSATYRRATQ